MSTIIDLNDLQGNEVFGGIRDLIMLDSTPLHTLFMKCEDCGFHTEITTAHRHFYDLHGRNNDLVIDSFITGFCQHLLETSHTDVIFKHTHPSVGETSKEVRFDGDFPPSVLNRYFIQKFDRLIEKAEITKNELEMIDSLIRTDADAEIVKELREQNFSNLEIINYLYHFHLYWKRSAAPKEGQSHLELDETTLKSTGKSVSVDDVIARIDEALDT